ncbi:hypothetical protein O7627_07550 [Solwaraspora sp. WMMD1047]|uniref:hypothetical protein n=1 Tax=Solwaraspora sp. WMMD1047 TaxID=3016102 RepID=UPI0024170027|nr:hypothetical protein [Solwaraspora sp. WMMD1047]MDG4829160.1 hypothetical protein [Solwaraspora sp. WMMD1047]
MTVKMHENTRFLRAVLQQDWDTYDALVGEFEQQNKGTPVAIIASAFSLAVEKRFGRTKDVGEIIRFVADARAALAEGRALPAAEAEALIFATLDMDEPGVADTVERLDIGTIAEIEGQLLFKLVADDGMSESELDAFLREAENHLERWQSTSGG